MEAKLKERLLPQLERMQARFKEIEALLGTVEVLSKPSQLNALGK